MDQSSDNAMEDVKTSVVQDDSPVDMDTGIHDSKDNYVNHGKPQDKLQDSDIKPEPVTSIQATASDKTKAAAVQPGQSELKLGTSQSEVKPGPSQFELTLGPSQSELKPGPSRSSDPVSSKIDELTSEQIDKYISSESLAQYEYSGDRHVLLYNIHQVEVTAPSGTENEEEERPGDEFFELSKGEAQRLLRDIIRTRDQLENGQLMTKAMRDLISAKKTLTTLYQYNYTVVRVHFPDGHVLQAVFKPLENVGKVKQFVAQHLEQCDMSFYLYLTPPKIVLQECSTLLDLKCVPTGNFYFGVPPSDQTSVESLDATAAAAAPQSFLKAQLLSSETLVSRNVADSKALEFRKSRNPALNFADDLDNLTGPTHSSKSSNPTTLGGSMNPNRPKTSSDKIPKWFKTGK